MKNKLTLLFTALIFATINVFAAKVSAVETYSDVMHKKIKAAVIVPDNYAAGKEFPVVYLLHGASGNYTDWISKATANVLAGSDTYKTIIVCVDGSVNSWYWDSPVDPAYKYETYVSKELVSYIDKNFKTIKNRSGRAITGLSMGGHGALYLAFKHQDVFGTVGSMSGGVDIRPFPKNWDMAKRLGTYEEHPEYWNAYTVTNMLDLLKPNSLSIIFDCGSEDFFFQVNNELHQKMLDKKIPHEYTVRPGAHNWPYWNNAINYQLLYFSTYFKKNNTN